MVPAQRVIEKAQPVCDPGLTGAVLYACKAGEERVARLRIRRERRHHERETRLPVRIRDARVLLFENVAGVVDMPQRKLLCHIDEVVFGKRQPWNRFLSTPHTLQIRNTLGSGYGPTERGEV